MPFTQTQIDAAKAIQHAAAHDTSDQVRLVAGPGTGKSSAIEERVRWLIEQGIQPTEICAISFTRSSSLDLRKRVHKYCTAHGQFSANQVRITTLHSLALRTLRAAGLLHAYPVDPLVLDNWELKTVFDAEFGEKSGIGKERREQIRFEHEAFWGTGQWDPANYIQPHPPITADERAQFKAFHGPRTQTFSCVLPGEIVRKCVEHMAAGSLNAVGLLDLKHLVVDEYQDLNPMDLEFVDKMAAQGAKLFVGGDDDQSIYSFRFASPAGIQKFISKYPHCGKHSLTNCFRCTPAIVATGQAVVAEYPQPDRIAKNINSLYETAEPPLHGIVHHWKFKSGVAEIRAIAKSCHDLAMAGIKPRDILILISNTKILLPLLETEFEKAGIDFEPPRSEGFLDSEVGRFVLAMIRIVSDKDDYVAHRLLLGLPRGVGITTCTAITDLVINNNLKYRSLFYENLPTGVFIGRAATALSQARDTCSRLKEWQAADTIDTRFDKITSIVKTVFDDAHAQIWQTYVGTLPSGMILAELRDYLWADSDEQQKLVLEATYNRLNLPIPETGVLPQRIRVMTMHGAKGLDAKVVFIPGLEEEILPGPWRKPYPGLILEAARLLYVSITRARAACIISYASTRVVQGQFTNHWPSRFTPHLSGTFLPRADGLNGIEVQDIVNEIAQL